MGRAEASLLALLDELDQNYGKKPSLLATRADYVESPQHREQLLREAYSESERMADGKNQELVAHSLASFYVEECRNDSEGARWLETWRRLLGVAPEQDDRNEVVRLTAALFGDSTA